MTQKEMNQETKSDRIISFLILCAFIAVPAGVIGHDIYSLIKHEQQQKELKRQKEQKHKTKCVSFVGEYNKMLANTKTK